MAAKDLKDKWSFLLGLQKIEASFKSAQKRGGGGLFSEMAEKRVRPNVKSNGTQGSGLKTKLCLEVVSLLSTKQKFILKTRIGATENS